LQMTTLLRSQSQPNGSVSNRS